MRRPSTNTLRILKSFVVLLRRTTWHCGKIERQIIKFLMKKHPEGAPAEDIIKHILTTYAPFKGKITYKIWDEGIKLTRKYGPTKGRIIQKVVDSLKRLEDRYIIKILSPYKKPNEK